jgi:tetratricopeptide (TPR) repeat protein
MTTISPLRPGPGGPPRRDDRVDEASTRPWWRLRPTDPETPEARAARLRLRKRLALWSLPFLVVLALVATKLLTMVALGDEALKSYTAGNVTGTEDAGKRLGLLNLIEAHKAPFARGDARVLAGDYEGARAAFEESLALAPKDSRESCQIRVNLALSLEKLGQAAQNAGNAAQAKQYLDRVQQVVNEAPPGCFEGPAQDEEGQQLRDAQQRAQDQQQQQQQQGQQQPDQQQQPSEDKQQQLDDKTKDNLSQRQQGDEQNGAVTKPPVDKPW